MITFDNINLNKVWRLNQLSVLIVPDISSKGLLSNLSLINSLWDRSNSRELCIHVQKPPFPYRWNYLLKVRQCFVFDWVSRQRWYRLLPEMTAKLRVLSLKSDCLLIFHAREALRALMYERHDMNNSSYPLRVT